MSFSCNLLTAVTMDNPSLLSRLNLPQKFTLLCLLGLFLASIPSYFYIGESGKLLTALKGEQEGLAPAALGLKAVQLTQQHRAMSALLLNGAPDAESKRDAKQAEADKAYALLEAEVRKLDKKPISAQWDIVWRDWQTLRGNVKNKAITSPQSFAAHSALVPKIITLNELISDHYGLSLDPDRDTYQLIQSMYYQLPMLTEELGRLRAKGTAPLTKKEITPEDRLALQGIIARVNDRLGQTSGAYTKAITENPDIDSKLTTRFKAAVDAATSISALAENEIIKPETLSYDALKWVAESTAAIDAQFDLNAAAAAEIDRMIAGKIDRFNSVRWMMLASCIALVAVAAYMAVLIMRSVTTPLNNAISVAQSVASGNLVNDFDVGPENEVGQLLRALKEMNDSLRTIVADVRHSVDSISAATHDIASGNADVSSRIESQASNLQETASSMEELTSTVRQNTENARQANDLVQSASTVASRGGSVVSQVVQTMGEINDSSRKIVDIIAVIDGIAFQTNILALNAAVEAARAGEQGRGFAVVAGEVRTLAQRSAAAAKEIKELINRSVAKVEAGNSLADQAGHAMEEILHSVQRITQIVSDIAIASEEQGSGIEQINQAVTQMDDMTQQNAALVEQTAAASASLEEQAAILVKAVSVFTIGTEGRPAQAKRPAAISGRARLPAPGLAASQRPSGTQTRR
jgi:methyl-accepting chemotaxis protein